MQYVRIMDAMVNIRVQNVIIAYMVPVKNTAFDCNECGADEFDKGFIAGANWRISSVWHSITVIPDCHCFIVFLPKKSTIGSKNPIMGILEENRTFISSRPGCILCRLDEMESWAYLDDLSL